MDFQIKANVYDDVGQNLASDSCHVWLISPQIHIATANNNKEGGQAQVKRRWVRSRIVLKKLAAKYADMGEESLELGNNAYGKPIFAKIPKLSFSITHTNDWIAVAFMKDEQIGLDIELSKRKVSAIALANRYFHKHEIDFLSSCSEDQRNQEFLRQWVIKESAVKFWGRGLSYDLASAVTHWDSHQKFWRVGGGKRNCIAWDFAYSELVGALAMSGDGKAIRTIIYVPDRLE